jgi:hypothetical protein
MPVMGSGLHANSVVLSAKHASRHAERRAGYSLRSAATTEGQVGWLHRLSEERPVNCSLRSLLSRGRVLARPSAVRRGTMPRTATNERTFPNVTCVSKHRCMASLFIPPTRTCCWNGWLCVAYVYESAGCSAAERVAALAHCKAAKLVDQPSCHCHGFVYDAPCWAASRSPPIGLRCRPARMCLGRKIADTVGMSARCMVACRRGVWCLN